MLNGTLTPLCLELCVKKIQAVLLQPVLLQSVLLSVTAPERLCWNTVFDSQSPPKSNFLPCVCQGAGSASAQHSPG